MTCLPWLFSRLAAAHTCRTNLLAICIAWLALPLLAWGHAFHISTAEMEFNPRTQKIEVSLKLHSVDLERALAKMSGAKVELEKSGYNDLLKKYLDRHFFLLPKEQAIRIDQGEVTPDELQRSQVSLVGTEIEAGWMWLYFEMESPVHNGDYAIVNTVLLDIAVGQINTISIRHHAQRHALRTNVKQPWGAIERRWLRP